MKTRTILVSALEGDPDVSPATLLVCDLCRGETFAIYLVRGQEHWHYQCAGCGQSYCPAGSSCAREVPS